MITLLTKGSASAKLAKDEGKGYLTAILYLASGQYDARLCPAAGACKRADLGLCLVLNSGHTGLASDTAEKGPKAAKIARSRYYFESPEYFLMQLKLELAWLEREAKALGLKPAARLNGGSDLDWSELYATFPNIQFWEYTKRPDLALKLKAFPNVAITYSFSENTSIYLFNKLVKAGVNIAVVFDTPKGRPLPAEFLNRPVIDGDTSDLRFLDTQGVIVGLRFKSSKHRKTKAIAGVKAGFIQPAA